MLWFHPMYLAFTNTAILNNACQISYGDLLQLIGTFFWTAHILLIDHFARRIEAFKLAFFQFMTCALLSLGSALV